ncbi:MAG TPA: flagellar protein FlaG [Bryobacteraceae bacterium]|jgi:uncharacterized FlaG/YvyC family protein
MIISSINSLAAQLSTPSEPVTPRQLEEQRSLVQAIKAVNASEMLGQDNELTFVLDRAARRAVARIVNKQTGEVVDQIPAEYVLRMAEELNRG